jgi:hypothetical protein
LTRELLAETTPATPTRANRIKVNIKASRIKANIKDRLIRVRAIKTIRTGVMRIVTTTSLMLARDMLALRQHAHMDTIPIIRMLARRTAITARNGSRAASSLVLDRGAGVVADTGVAGATGDVVVGVAQAGVTDAATWVDMGGAMHEEPTDAVTRVADIAVAPFAAVAVSTETLAAYMVVAVSTVEADTPGADIVAVVTVADTDN